jgi:8-oxo-dGTP diphosphatase
MHKIVGEKLNTYPEKTFTHAATATDVVLFRVQNNELQVLLLKLKEDPFPGKWAIPGGLVTNKESLDMGAKRHLENKIGLKDKVYLEQLYTFGSPDRDPLGWVISVAYIGLVSSKNITLNIAKRYAGHKWFPVSKLPDLAYDHEEIIQQAVKRLVTKATYTNILGHLIKKQFTLTELQQMYELITNRELDKRNFRKKILSLDIIKPLKKLRKEGPQRPAMLYSFVTSEVIEAPIL